VHTVLWLLQIVLARAPSTIGLVGAFCSAAYTHGLRTAQVKMQRGMQRMGAAARPLLVACREKPRIAVGLALFALAAFVAYGRRALASL